MDTLKTQMRYMEVQKKAKDIWSEHGKNYTKNELIILARAARIKDIYAYKKHELALKLGIV